MEWKTCFTKGKCWEILWRGEMRQHNHGYSWYFLSSIIHRYSTNIFHTQANVWQDHVLTLIVRKLSESDTFFFLIMCLHRKNKPNELIGKCIKKKTNKMWCKCYANYYISVMLGGFNNNQWMGKRQGPIIRDEQQPSTFIMCLYW